MPGIGEFARQLGVTVRMLRHYDALGLLVPEHVDPVTGWRSYGIGQLDRGNRLVALRELGIGLDGMGPLLDDGRDPQLLAAALRARRDGLRARIAADRDVLARLERRLLALEGGDVTALEFTTKPLPALHLVQIRATVAEQSEITDVIGPLFGRLGALAEAGTIAPTGPAVAWYRPTGEGMDLAAALPVAAPVAPDALAGTGATVTELPACPRAVTVLHRGPMTTINTTWQALARRADEDGHELLGPAREVYLHMPLGGDQSEWVTELQQPVA